MQSKVAKNLLEGVETGNGRVLTEYESKKIFRAAGIPVTEEILAETIEDAIAAGAKIGYPLVLKISSPDVRHKSDFGGVYVGLRDEAELELAASNIREQALAEGIEFAFLVQEMAEAGQELLVGSKRDPTFGPALIFGLGGVFTEILDDVSIRIPPIDREEARRMVREIRGAPVLDGFRGMPPLDIEAIIDVILKVATIMETYEAITELDINPLLGYENGVLAVDGLIVL
ncbi:acetyl-CoA synthetase [Methanosarcinales archaeon]|nr:MAG: acetyl-CoA synthetase [Methanosarcinales archaeon]